MRSLYNEKQNSYIIAHEEAMLEAYKRIARSYMAATFFCGGQIRRLRNIRDSVYHFSGAIFATLLVRFVEMGKWSGSKATMARQIIIIWKHTGQCRR